MNFWSRVLRYLNNDPPEIWYGVNATFGNFLTFLYVRHIASLVCTWKGHKIVDCSTAGPDTGNMDCYCSRCGRYWDIPLY